MSAGAFVRAYLDRVVNEADPTAVDELVAPDWRGEGPGWPADIAALRSFYAAQARDRPGWRINVEETVELGEWVAVRARAGVGADHAVEWLALFQVRDRLLAHTRIVSIQSL